MQDSEPPVPLTIADQTKVLNAFSRALDREGHNLSRWPHLAWQQLYNRLQWEEEPVPSVLAPELARRTAPGAAPWLRLRTPLRESAALIRTLAGHTGRVTACAVGPDSSFIVSASDDKTLKIWDADTGRERATLVGHTGPVKACAISPDGSFIVSASGDETVRIWDALTGANRACLDGPKWFPGAPFYPWRCALAISPEGRWIVSQSGHFDLKIWEAEAAILRSTLHGTLFPAISSDGTLVVSVDLGADLLKTWDAETGTKQTSLGLANGPPVISPDGSFIVSVGLAQVEDDDYLEEEVVLDIRDTTGGMRATLAGHHGAVEACAISPDGSLILSAGLDMTIRLWDAQTGAERAMLAGHSNAISDCAFSPNGSFIVSASADKTLKIWDVREAAEGIAPICHSLPVVDCVVSPDGNFIVSASHDTTLKIWGTQTGAERATLKGHEGPVVACAITPDGGLVVSASYDYTLKIWEAGTGAELRTLAGHTAQVDGCAISPDGSFIVSSSWDETMKIWDAETGAERATLKGREIPFPSFGRFGFTDCGISADGSLIISARVDDIPKLWDVTGTERAALAGHAGWVEACDFSPDGSFVCTASLDRTLKLWHLATGECLRTLEGHTLGVNCCAVAPDASLVVSASWDGTLKLWDATTGEEVVSMPLLGGLRSMALHPSQPLVACGGADGNVYLIDLVSIEYGPIIVTAVDRDSGPTVRCPACLEYLALEAGWLGEIIACPRLGCDGRMRVNPFVTKMRSSRPEARPDAAPWWQFWRRG